MKNQDGKVIFGDQKEFHVGDLYFKGGKQVAMAEWDVTATEHFDLGLKALETSTYTFIVPLDSSISSVIAEAEFRYLYTRDKIFSVKKIVKELSID